MSVVTEEPTGAPAVGPPPAASEIGPIRAFVAVLGRDCFVTGRELPIFLAQLGERNLEIVQTPFVLSQANRSDVQSYGRHKDRKSVV